MQTLTQIKDILESRGLAPKRSLGQNFLVDHNLIRKLVDASGVGRGDLVLEVGPGTGTMTEELLARGCEVVACELDDGLADHLRDHFGAEIGAGRMTLVHGDCLAGKHAVNPEILRALGGRPFSLVANLPYGAGTPLMSALLVDHPECGVLAVTIQREVADRLLARHGSKEFGPLAVIAQAAAEVSRVASAPPECFWPRPEVTSSMALVRRRAAPRGDLRRLSDFCRVAFAHRRKQLGSVLDKSVDWAGVARRPGLEGVRPTDRAEGLSIEQLIGLSEAVPVHG